MTTRRLIMYAAGAVSALVLGGFAIAWSGLYNVAASEGHLAIVDHILRFGMHNSVETQASDIVAPHIDDGEMVKLGAVHFERGCRACHGAPGFTPNPIMQQTLPPAPDLTSKIGNWRDRELFWLVKNGLKYTAMPGWSAQERADEVWAVVAFLRKLPTLDDQSYAQLSGTNLTTKPPDVTPVGAGALLSETRGCVACHGSPGMPPTNALTPALHGQTQQMLRDALQNYAKGTRASGIMQPVASQLTADEMQTLAQEYADAKTTAISPSGQSSERGKALFEDGDPATNIPACRACHTGDASPAYPRLPGLSARYVSNQLRLWKKGGRTTGPLAAIMAPIAQRLSDRDIDDVSAYIATTTADQ